MQLFVILCEQKLPVYMYIEVIEPNGYYTSSYNIFLLAHMSKFVEVNIMVGFLLL